MLNCVKLTYVSKAIIHLPKQQKKQLSICVICLTACILPMSANQLLTYVSNDLLFFSFLEKHKKCTSNHD